MKNMVEVILDDEKIIRMGQYTPETIHASVDNLFVNQAGMVKEGNFYVDYNPYNCMGIGMDCIMELAGKQWFRDSVKEMRWYRDIHHYGPGNDYYVEDVVENLLKDWEKNRRLDGLPVNC